MSDDISRFSDDAKAVAGGWFGMMRPGGPARLALELKVSKPSERTQAALDELVAKGAVAREDTADGGVAYRPLVDCGPMQRWVAKNGKNPDLKFELMEPILAASIGPGPATLPSLP